VKLEGPKPEAQRADNRSGVLGERCGPAAKKFYCIPEAPNCLSWNLSRPSSRGVGGHGPLKSAYAINIVSKVTYQWSLVVVWLAEPV